MPVMACNGLREMRTIVGVIWERGNERVRCVRGLDQRGERDHSIGRNITYLSYWMTGKTV
jgi:hypothetical protein